MKLTKSTLICLLLVCALIFALPGCGKEEAPATEAPTETTAPVEQLALVVTEEDISQLEQYKELKELDLTGSTCYAAIAEYAAILWMWSATVSVIPPITRG